MLPSSIKSMVRGKGMAKREINRTEKAHARWQAWRLARRLLSRALLKPANRHLCLSIMICTCIASGLSLFFERVQRSLDDDIANYLGAPLVLRGDRAIQLDNALLSARQVRWARTTAVNTGAIANDSYQTVRLKGVSTAYPVQGELRVRTDSGERLAAASALGDQQAWVDARVLDDLNINLGDSVQIGRAQFTVVATLAHEPDRLTQLQHALPTFMVSQKGLRSTGVIDASERAEYRVLIKADSRELQQLKTVLRSELEHKGVNFLEPSAGKHPFSRIAKRAEHLLIILVILTVLMCGAAAAILAEQVAAYYAKTVAIMRCMGLRRAVVSRALGLQLLALVLLCGIGGLMLAYLVQPLLARILEPYVSLPPIFFHWQFASLQHLAPPLVIGALAVVTFVIPKLMGLSRESVTSILRGQMQKTRYRLVSVCLAFLLVISGLWWSSDNSQLTTLLIAALVFVLVGSSVCAWLLSKLAAQAHHFARGPSKVIMRSIGSSISASQAVSLISIALVTMAILLTTLLRGSFINMLQAHLLEVDGNYLFSGLPISQTANFERLVNRHQASVTSMHPTVSAQLVTINEITVDQALNAESESREEARSKVRLSWAAELPRNNRLLEGRWPQSGAAEVSVEDEVMQDLRLELGDRLGFQIGDQRLNATIVSRRVYRAGGSRMMFWFMFPQGVLEGFKVTMMGGMSVPHQDPQAPVLSSIAHQHPMVRVTDLESQISGIRKVMAALTRLLNLALGLLAVAACTVILASSQASTQQRGRLFVLMQVLGLRKSACLKMGTVEQITIAAVACLVGLLGVQLIGAALFSNVFSLPFVLDWLAAAKVVISICVVFAIFGVIMALNTLRKPLRESMLYESFDS